MLPALRAGHVGLDGFCILLSHFRCFCNILALDIVITARDCREAAVTLMSYVNYESCIT